MIKFHPVALLMTLSLIANYVKADNKGWTWIGGRNTPNGRASYGAWGQYSDKYIPRAMRSFSHIYIPELDLFYVLGGEGIDVANGEITKGYVNNLYAYSPSTMEWAFLGGYHFLGDVGIKEDRGEFSPSSWPSARYGDKLFYDNTTKIFTMYGNVKSSLSVSLYDEDDMWQYDIATSQWKHVKFNSTVPYEKFNQTEIPIKTVYTVSEFDEHENERTLYVNGGLNSVRRLQYDAHYRSTEIWEYKWNTKGWNVLYTQNSSNVYGTYAGPIVYPGSRTDFYSAYNPIHGQIYVFGGYGLSEAVEGLLSDLWIFNMTSSKWEFAGGSTSTKAASVFGTIKTFSPESKPGKRSRGGAFFSVKTMKFYIFGGMQNTAPFELLNELWEYDPGLKTETFTTATTPTIPANRPRPSSSNTQDNNSQEQQAVDPVIPAVGAVVGILAVSLGVLGFMKYTSRKKLSAKAETPSKSHSKKHHKKHSDGRHKAKSPSAARKKTSAA